MVRFLRVFTGIWFAFFLFPSNALAATPQPTIAVYGFSWQGINPWWGIGFDPSAALSDILTEKLVNAGSFSVVDRSHIQQILNEQNISQPGDVTPATEAQLGRMMGAEYLIVGRIDQFDRSGGNGAQLLGRFGVSTSKTELHVTVEVLNVNTGRIVQDFDDDKSVSNTSVAMASNGVGYTSQNFESSSLGQLFAQVATDITGELDPSKYVATAMPSVVGHIVGSAGPGTYVLDVGSASGVQIGMMFSTFEVRLYHDQATGHTIRAEIPEGTIQIISVSGDSSIAKRVSGPVGRGQLAKSGP